MYNFITTLVSGYVRDLYSASSRLLEPTGRKRRWQMVIESDSDNAQTLQAKFFVLFFQRVLHHITSF